MSDGTRILTIPRANPIDAHTMGGIAKDAGLTVEEFKEKFVYPEAYFVPLDLPSKAKAALAAES